MRSPSDPIPRSVPVLLGLALLAGACVNDTTLREAPPRDPVGEEGPGGGPGTPPTGGGWPGLPPLPGGPWGELDPGEMPEVYFIAAFADPDCCWNCDGYYSTGDVDGFPDESSADMGFECSVTYGVIDLRGQVLAEFHPTDWMPGAQITHLDIAPSGPGRFLATSQGWGEGLGVLTDPPEEELPPEDGPIDTYTWLPWMAWEIDAVLGTTTLVAYQDPSDYSVVIPETGKRIEAGAGYAVQAALDPVDPDWLYVWGTRYGCEQNPMPLRATHRFDAGVLDRFWSMDEILPNYEGSNRYANGMAASVDETGRTHLMLDLADMGCGDGLVPSNLVADFVPDDGSSWSLADVLGHGSNGVSWAPWNGGAILQVDSPWDEPRWFVNGPTGESEGEPPGLTWNVRPGPMLDPAGPTFALLGGEPVYPARDSIVFVHGGQEVWRLDSLRFGLQDRDVVFMDLIVLPPVPDEEPPVEDPSGG